MTYRYVLLSLALVASSQFAALGEEFKGWYGVEPGKFRWNTKYGELHRLVESNPAKALEQGTLHYKLWSRRGALASQGDPEYLALLDSVIVAAAAKQGDKKAIDTVIGRTHPSKKQWYEYVDALIEIDKRAGKGPEPSRVLATYLYDALNTHGNVVLYSKNVDTSYDEAMQVAAVAEVKGGSKAVTEYLKTSEERLDKSPLQEQGAKGKHKYYRYKAGFAAAKKDFRQAVRYEVEAMKLIAAEVDRADVLELRNYLCSLSPYGANAFERGQTIGEWSTRINRAYAAYKSGSKESIATALYRDFDDTVAPGKTPDVVSLYLKGLLLEVQGKKAESLGYYRDVLILYPDFLPALQRQATLAGLLLKDDAAVIRRVAKAKLEPQFQPVVKEPVEKPRVKAEEVEVEQTAEEEMNWLDKLDDMLKKPEHRKAAKAKAERVKKVEKVEKHTQQVAEETKRLERELALAIEQKVEADSKPYKANVEAYKKCLARYGDTDYATPGKLLVGEYLPGKTSK